MTHSGYGRPVISRSMKPDRSHPASHTEEEVGKITSAFRLHETLTNARATKTVNRDMGWIMMNVRLLGVALNKWVTLLFPC